MEGAEYAHSGAGRNRLRRGEKYRPERPGTALGGHGAGSKFCRKNRAIYVKLTMLA